LSFCSSYVLVTAIKELPPPPPGFTPVPVRARRDGWTPERQFGYLVALSTLGRCGQAARAVGMSQRSAMRLRRRPEAAHFDGLCTAALWLAKERHARARLERLRGADFSTTREAET
jgi:hypothetical protein